MTTVPIEATRVEMTQITLPPHGNALGNLFGGQIAAWIDMAAAVSAQRFCRGIVVTASMDELAFLEPIRVGMIVILLARVNRAWRTSMEVGVRVEGEEPTTGQRIHACSAYLTFVALGADGKPREVPALDVGGDPGAERRFAEAQLRRDSRLRMREMRQRLSG